MDELYVIARRVLLDALEALAEHRDAVILVGAQAVYLRVGEADVAVAPYTTDGDLAIEPALLGEIPPIEEALHQAGFTSETDSSVGVWVTHQPTSHNFQTKVTIDLLVPSLLSPGKGRRAAQLSGHDRKAARKVEGLEGVVVDFDRLVLGALEQEDSRSFEVRVAGQAALLIAKTYKIADRRGGSRESDKDALDVLRLLRGTSTEDLVARFRRLLLDARSRDTARSGLALFREQFASPHGMGVEMAVRSVGALMDPDEVIGSCTLLAAELLKHLDEYLKEDPQGEEGK